MSLSNEVQSDRSSVMSRNIVKIQAVDNGFIVTVDKGMSYKQLVFQRAEAAEMVEEITRILGIMELVYDQTSLEKEDAAQSQSSAKSASTLSSDSV